MRMLPIALDDSIPHKTDRHTYVVVNTIEPAKPTNVSFDRRAQVKARWLGP